MTVQKDESTPHEWRGDSKRAILKMKVADALARIASATKGYR
jgi:hypothetical protein